MAENSGIAPVSYRPRIVDAQIAQYLGLFGAVEISGTKWCGKTWAALAHGESVTYVDRGTNLQITRADPAYALAGEKPHVIDEWQRVPAIWDNVRHAVDDAGGQKGLWILTGSSTPLAPEEKSHSGAGRIGRIRMHTMTLQESGDSCGRTSLRDLFEGTFAPTPCENGITELAELACRGGWPEVAGKPSEEVQIIVREYLSLIFEESVPRFKGDAAIARRVALSLARNLGQAPTAKTIAKDAFSLLPDEDPAESQLKTAADRLSILKRLYMIDEVPGWVPAARSPQRMRTKPKLYFADPSMVPALLGLGAEALLNDWQTLGLVFENMVMRDLDVYARALPSIGPAPLRYYRDDAGLEVDAVIERADGSWAALEIKLSQEKVDDAAANLLRLKKKLLKNERGRTPEPVFLAVVTGMGEASYRRPDGVYVIPIRCLGA
ncbi:DUF4143 domain-containing protein [Adlercreutzia sp. R21]|uniref:ATP-binding protein n=1 Tax=Adlercreutzia wanghongyangiae TaxID=3111451 RepID=UPI002DB9F7D9|nr:DUF4143 domain-containing protein [Adlercreutzia sp. R21]MEC4184809.1 DUF4143 domain-containing protein [Adlercreutzia sp. R21]